MRPKHVLWIIVAALSTAWYVLDPQARFPEEHMQASAPDASNPLLAERKASRPEHNSDVDADL